MGTFQSAGARILPGVVREFRSRWPEVRVEIREELNESILLEAVAAGALDLTFASAAQPVPPQLDSEVLLEDRYVLLAPPGSPYRGRANVELAELDGLDVIEPPRASRASRSCSGRGPPPARAARRSSARTTT